MTTALELSKTTFANTDTGDAAKTVLTLDENCVFQFANLDVVKGRANIQAFLAAFFESIDSIRHDIVGVYEDGDRITTQVDVVYTRKDGTKLSVPAATIWQVRDEKIVDYRIFIDASALYQVRN